MNLGQMSVGSIVKLKYNGTDMPFCIMHHGKPDPMYSDAFLNGTILMQDKKDPGFQAELYESTMHGCDYPNSNIYAYLRDTVFGGFEPLVQKMIRTVQLPYRYGTEGKVVRSGSEGAEAKIWMPSGAECTSKFDYHGNYQEIYVQEGAMFDFWKGKTAGEYRQWLIRKDGREWPFRTRTPLEYGSSESNFLEVREDGVLYKPEVFSGSFRVCMVLPDATEFDDNMHIMEGQIIPVYSGGIWRSGAMWLKTNGTWRQGGRTYAKTAGIWRN